MEQRKLTDQANTVADLAKVSAVFSSEFLESLNNKTNLNLVIQSELIMENIITVTSTERNQYVLMVITQKYLEL